MTIDEEPVTLSSHALDALKEFYSERDTHVEKFEQLKAAPDESDDETKTMPLSMAAFREDWQESQFWYTDETACFFASQLIQGATEDMTIAVVSVPSTFVALKNIMNETGGGRPMPKLVLLEHDLRFSVFSEFVYYDYNAPTKLPDQLKGSINRLIIDPPFLNPDCQTKMALTARWLAKPGPDSTKTILVTGERMESLVLKLYKPFDLRTTTYDVVHTGLKNEFYCYANFACGGWSWKEN